MPFFKPKEDQIPRSKRLEALVSRKGFRIATYGTNLKGTIRRKYTGEFINDMKHGNGVQEYEDGTSYEGEWRYGKRSGEGALSRMCGRGIQTRIYTGEWLDDQPYGLGVKNFLDGGSYKGSFVCGYRDGYGCMKYPNGYVYVGEWKRDMRWGIGKYLNTATGNYYQGEFKEDMKWGRGRFYHVHTGQVQDGAWEKDVAKVTIMWDDVRYREAAEKPTKYDIPPTQLQDPFDIFTDAAYEVLDRKEEKKPKKGFLPKYKEEKKPCKGFLQKYHAKMKF